MGIVNPADTLPDGVIGLAALDSARNLKVNVVAGGAGGGAVTIADGADVCEGATTDAAVATDATGTVSGKLRGLVKLLAAVINIPSGYLAVMIQNATLAVTQSGTWSISAASGGGWLASSQTALSSTGVTVKGSAGQVGGYDFFNPNASTVYLQFFNKTSPTVGTDVPFYVKGLPAGAGSNVEFTLGIAHGTAISVAATTTATGGSAPASALTGFVLYK
jgi:hypothetical protein